MYVVRTVLYCIIVLYRKQNSNQNQHPIGRTINGIVIVTPTTTNVTINISCCCLLLFLYCSIPLPTLTSTSAGVTATSIRHESSFELFVILLSLSLSQIHRHRPSLPTLPTSSLIISYQYLLFNYLFDFPSSSLALSFI